MIRHCTTCGRPVVEGLLSDHNKCPLCQEQLNARIDAGILFLAGLFAFTAGAAIGIWLFC